MLVLTLFFPLFGGVVTVCITSFFSKWDKDF